MIETAPLYSDAIPLAFFVWAPAGVMLFFWLAGVWASRAGVPRLLESDWNGFTAADVDKLFSAYGETRRRIYRNRVLPADIAFAFFYGIVGALTIYALVTRGQPLWLAALCGGGWLLGAVFDVVENFTVARLLDRYPTVAERDVAIASRVTQFKLVLFSLGTLGAIAAAWLAWRPLAG
jgi:hypothetical protein